MLNKESEYTYVTSKDADVENGNFVKNVGMTIGTEKMSIRHGGLDEGGQGGNSSVVVIPYYEIDDPRVTWLEHGTSHATHTKFKPEGE